MSTRPPKLWHFVFLPPAATNPPMPFASEWSEMPREHFRSLEQAQAAARDFVGRYSGGGYREDMDYWWARDDIDTTAAHKGQMIDGKELQSILHRFTRFTIEPLGA